MPADCRLAAALEDVPGNFALDYLYGDPAKVGPRLLRAPPPHQTYLINSRLGS